MSFLNKYLKREADHKPVPQHFNAVIDDFEETRGRNHAMFMECVPVADMPTNQVVIPTLNEAVALAVNQPCRELLVQADPDNDGNVLIGNATAQYIKLEPGSMFNIKPTNVNLLYVKAISGTIHKINWMVEA